MTLHSDEVIRGLKRAGFSEISQKGSHLKLRSSAGRTVIVPTGRDLRRGTLQSILRQAGLSLDELLSLL